MWDDRIDRVVSQSKQSLIDTLDYKIGYAAKELAHELTLTDDPGFTKQRIRHYLSRATKVSRRARKIRGRTASAAFGCGLTLALLGDGCAGPATMTAKVESGVKETSLYHTTSTGASSGQDGIEVTATASIQWSWPANAAATTTLSASPSREDHANLAMGTKAGK